MTALKLEVRDLRIELRGLKKSAHQQLQAVQDAPSPAGSDVGKRKRSTTVSSQDDHINTCGRKFAVMNELYVPRGAFMVVRPADVYSDDPHRWDSQTSAMRGVVAELYEEIPEDLHDMLAHHSSFRNKVQYSGSLSIFYLF